MRDMEERYTDIKSELRYSFLKKIVDSTLDGFWLLGEKGKFLDVNPSYCRMSGYSREELLGMSIRDVEAMEDPETTQRKIQQLMSEGQLYFMTRHRRKDGSTFPLEVSSTYHDEDGGVIVAFLRDLSEREKAQETLRENEAKWRGYIENAPFGIFVVNSEGRYIDISEEGCRITGYSREELLQMSIPDILAEESMEAGLESWKKLQAGERFQGDFALKHGSGAVHWYSIQSAELGDGRYIAFKKDITQERDREKYIEMLSMLLDAAPALVTIQDTRGRFIFINRAQVHLHGYSTKEEMLGLNLSDLNHPESREMMKERIKQIMEEGEARFEVIHYRKDGSTFPIEIAAKKIDWFGEPAIMSVGTDIGRRKAAAEAIQERERQLETLMSNLPGMVYRCSNTPDWPMIFVSEGSRDLTGYAPVELMDGGLKSYGELIHEDDRQMVWEEIQKAIEELHPFVLEYRIQHRNGDVRWVWEQGRFVETGQGDEKILEGFIQDITVRKTAEHEQTLFKTIFDAANYGVVIIEEDGEMYYSNRKFAEMHGYDPAELKGQHMSILHSPFEREKVKKIMHSMRTEGSFGPLEVVRRHRDGSEFPILMNGIIIPGGKGEPVRMAAAALDISVQKRLEQELSQARKMESVGRLAGGVAHDFNNMLGVIIGHTEMILNDMDRGNLHYRDIEAIRKAADRSADLTRQLLAFARKQTISPKRLDLNRTVENMLEMLRRLIGENIQLNWQPTDSVAEIRMDPGQIDQILANLCVNARDAIRGHGTISISTELHTVSGRDASEVRGLAAGEYVILKVRDDGSGMSDEVQDKLFEPFFTTKDVGSGTGLGLATVYGIIKQNRGYIGVESEIGKGSEFTIYLPRVQEKASDTGGAAVEKRGSASGTEEGRNWMILLVEDEPAILSLGEIMLERFGYRVLAAATPGEALEMARQHEGEIHCLITDVIMPEMNGRDLARQLLSLYPKMKRIFMSGYTADIIAHQGVLDEGTDFLQKPFSMDSLGKKILEVMAKN